MKAHTQTFKENLITLGKEIDAKITYTINGTTTELDGDQIGSVNPHYEGAILKSVMKQMDIVCDNEIPVNTEVNVQFGMRYNSQNYEYIDFGNYIVFSVEKQEDTNNYKIVCYDKMLYAMKDYEELNVTYPITVRDYIGEICDAIGLTFANANDTFANYDENITADFYNNQLYTYRDILDELAQVTASTICINEDDELEVRYINNTYTNEFEIIGNTTQDGTPTPTNPIPIINKTGIIEEEINGVIRTLNIKDIWLGAINDYKDKIFKGKGINLFDKDNVRAGYRLTDSGYYADNGYNATEFIGVKPSTTHSTSWTMDWSECVCTYDINQTFVRRIMSGTSFTTSGTEYYIRADVKDAHLSTAQINEGNQVLPYEPYNAKDKWLLHKEIGKVVLNGSENWIFNNSYTYNVFYISIDTLKKELNVITTMSNYYKGVKNVGLADFGNTYNNSVAVRGYNDTYYHLYISNDTINSVADFKTWLSTHNTEVYYVLANPTTTEITDKEIINSLNDTGLDIIDEDYIKNVRASFGKKYGPINSIVLSRSAESDNVYLQDEDSIEENGLCEIKIKDNQIMNDNTRDRFLPDILQQLDGLEYYINDYESIGITYLDLCDRYNVKIGDTIYPCIMFNDDIEIHDGLNERIYTDEPEENVTDYKKADKTDRRINQTTLIVDKQNQRIDAVVSTQEEFEESLSSLSVTVDGIQSKVELNYDFVRETSGNNYITVDDIQQEGLLELKITGTAISDGYLRLHITNNDPEYVDLPLTTLLKQNDDLYDILSIEAVYNQETELYELHVFIDKQLDYVENQIVTRHSYTNFLLNQDSTKITTQSAEDLLLEDYVEGKQDLGIINIPIQEGQHTFSLVDFNNMGYYLKYAVLNNITSEFALKKHIVSEINQSAEEIQINADKVSLNGKTIEMTSDNININSDNFKVDTEGNMTCNNANINGTINSSNGTIGGWTVNSDGLNNGSVIINKNGASTIYTVADITVIRMHILEPNKYGLSGWALQHYDLNEDGVVDLRDLVLLQTLLGVVNE